MKQMHILTIVLILSLSACTSTQQEFTENLNINDLSITSGLSSWGSPLEYVTITSDGILHNKTSSQSSNNHVTITPISEKEWNDLILSLNLDRFFSIPGETHDEYSYMLSYPECVGPWGSCANPKQDIADGSYEYIIIKANNKERKIVFFTGATVVGLEEFVSELTKIRDNTYSKNLLSECEQESDIKAKNRCYTNAAMLANKVSICSLINSENDYANCQKTVALETQNLSLCNDIKNETHKIDCYYHLATKIGDSSLCKKVNEERKNFCYFSIASSTLNSQLCNKITDQVSVDRCKNSVKSKIEYNEKNKI